MIIMKGILILNRKDYKCLSSVASTGVTFSASPREGGAAGRAVARLVCSDVGMDPGTHPGVKPGMLVHYSSINSRFSSPQKSSRFFFSQCFLLAAGISTTAGLRARVRSLKLFRLPALGDGAWRLKSYPSEMKLRSSATPEELLGRGIALTSP